MGKADRFALVGNTIAGTFRVDDIVAEGGFGVVYRAYHLHFRAPVALKCLKIPDELTAEERHEFLEQFRSEAEIMFRLSASLPNIVRPLHVDAVQAPTGEFVPLMALEWLEGKSFEKIIEERSFAGLPPLPLSDTLDLLEPAADALDAAHHFEDGTMVVVHRDIKPDNLFLTNVGGKPHVKILDFGISKMRRHSAQGAGRVSQTSGQAPFSPAYGAPEQWVPKRFGQTGPWTDVWGLALTLVEIIKGDAVIVGDHQAMMGTALDPLSRPTPRKEGVEVSNEIEGVFEKALALDPRYRFQTVKAFWAALRRALELGGDPTRSKDTPVDTKIKLPPMVAPTPWTAPPGLREPGTPAIQGLPPMMAPAPLEASTPEEPSSVPAYPRDPESGLAPLLLADLPNEHELHIPSLDEETTPAPVAVEFDVEPRFELATSSGLGPRTELRLELDEEALADAVASPRASMALLGEGPQRSAVHELSRDSVPPESIDLPSDFAPVELTPIHRLEEAVPATRPQSPVALEQIAQAQQGLPSRPLPEVPDLTPSRAPRGGIHPEPPTGRERTRARAGRRRKNDPTAPPPRRSLPAPPERRAAAASTVSDPLPETKKPNRPGTPNDEVERGPPPPPRREKAR